MRLATMKVANEGWTRVDVQNNEFAIVAGPKCSEGLVHLVVYCDLTRKVRPNDLRPASVPSAQAQGGTAGVTANMRSQDYGLTICTVLDRLQRGWSNTKRVFIQLEFGRQITCAVDHVKFGCWVSGFVESVLDMHFSGPCRVFVGITDGNNPFWDISKLISALGTDKRWFADDPAVTIMLHRGRAVDIGNTYGVGGRVLEAASTSKMVFDPDLYAQLWLGG